MESRKGHSGQNSRGREGDAVRRRSRELFEWMLQRQKARAEAKKQRSLETARRRKAANAQKKAKKQKPERPKPEKQKRKKRKPKPAPPIAAKANPVAAPPKKLTIDNLSWEIYALIDPRTGTVHYVGATMNLRLRFRSHCDTSKHEGSRKTEWVRDLKACGLLPEVLVLQSGKGVGNAADAERKWIKHFRGLQPALTNVMNGGYSPIRSGQPGPAQFAKPPKVWEVIGDMAWEVIDGEAVGFDTWTVTLFDLVRSIERLIDRSVALRKARESQAIARANLPGFEEVYPCRE